MRERVVEEAVAVKTQVQGIHDVDGSHELFGEPKVIGGQSYLRIPIIDRLVGLSIDGLATGSLGVAYTSAAPRAGMSTSPGSPTQTTLSAMLARPRRYRLAGCAWSS